MWGRGDTFAIGVSVSFVDKCRGMSFTVQYYHYNPPTMATLY